MAPVPQNVATCADVFKGDVYVKMRFEGWSATEGEIGTSVETEVIFAYEGETTWQRYNKGQSRHRDNHKCNQISEP